MDIITRPVIPAEAGIYLGELLDIVTIISNICEITAFAVMTRRAVMTRSVDSY